MAKQSLSQQLDQLVDTLIANPQSAPAPVNVRLAALLRIAAELRDLPRQEFKARLKSELERRTMMITSKPAIAAEKAESRREVTPIRAGFHTITPYLLVQGAAQLVDFVKQAFGATELYRGTGSAGGLHAEVGIGDSIVMIGGREGMDEMPAALHVYVEDVDTVYQRALRAGATSIQEAADQDYGERGGSVKDPFGNHWYIATPLGGKPVPEGLRSVTPYLHPRGAAKVIDFLKQAFGAEEAARYQSPDGTIVHAKVRIGDSMVEMGEAHGPYQPMPATFYLYVEDCDGLYQRALRAGASSISEPADQPYGDRNAGVKDPFDNVWYIATHIKDMAPA